MKIKHLVLPLVLFTTVSAYADTSGVDPYATDCRNDGGMVMNMTLVIDGGGTAISSGESHEVCMFADHTGNRLEFVDAATLSSPNPSLAATAYRNAPIVKIPANESRSDVYYCQYLGGTVTIGSGLNGGYAQNITAGEVSMCMFSDGSIVDTWSLFYKRFANNPVVDLTPYFGSPVLAVAPGALWGK